MNTTPEKLKLIFRSDVVPRTPVVEEQQDHLAGPGRPPTLGQVPAALRQTPLPAEDDPARELALLTPPSPESIPVPLDRPLPAEEAFACVERSIANGHTLNDVVFNTLISACAREGLVDKAFAAFALMKTMKIEPNAYTFDFLISACENNGLFERSNELLDEAVQRGICQATLGFNKEANEMDFHRRKILTGEQNRGGVSVPFARALFRRHRLSKVAALGPGTLLIVGQHGAGLILKAIVKCIEDEGGTADYQRKDGYINYGAVYWTAPRQQPGLNPNAGEFVPSWASSNPRFPLNPNAQEFVPSPHALNPNAREFVPGQKLQ